MTIHITDFHFLESLHVGLSPKKTPRDKWRMLSLQTRRHSCQPTKSVKPLWRQHWLQPVASTHEVFIKHQNPHRMDAYSPFMPVFQQETLLSQRDRATCLSVEILQLQNITIVWHYFRDPTFSRFYTIPKCDRHTHTDGRIDTRRRHVLRLA